MSNDEKEKLAQIGAKDFLYCLLVDGLLITGGAFVLAMCLFDYGWAYFFEESLPNYSGYYFAKKIVLGAIFGLFMGFVDWSSYVNSTKRQDKIK